VPKMDVSCDDKASSAAPDDVSKIQEGFATFDLGATATKKQEHQQKQQEKPQMTVQEQHEAKTKAQKKAEKKKMKKFLAHERQVIEKTISTIMNMAKIGPDGKPRDNLKDFAAFAKFERDGLSLMLEQFPKAQAEEDKLFPDKVVEFCLQLTEKNMRKLYKISGWDWKPSQKRNELSSGETRIIIAFEQQEDGAKTPVAFMHFRFEREDDELVLYVYEVQLEERLMRKGLGRHFMLLAELFARKTGMGWVSLTVLNANTAAKKFYAKLGYTLDETSPQADIFEESGTPYRILSRKMPAPKV